MSYTETPTPRGRYRSAKRHGSLIFVSGMTPRDKDVLLRAGPATMTGSFEGYSAATELATANAMRAVHGQLLDGEVITGVLDLKVYINALPDFTAHSRVADFASRQGCSTLCARHGPDGCAAGAA